MACLLPDDDTEFGHQDGRQAVMQRRVRQPYALNTHLDNRSEAARRRAATQLARYLTNGLDPELPRIVTGDFNAPAVAGTSVYDTMLHEGSLVDSWTRAAKRGEHYGTWHGYKQPVPGGVRIDWILTSPDVITRYAAINAYCDQVMLMVQRQVKSCSRAWNRAPLKFEASQVSSGREGPCLRSNC